MWHGKAADFILILTKKMKKKIAERKQIIKAILLALRLNIT
jgi:hypothetical protein